MCFYFILVDSTIILLSVHGIVDMEGLQILDRELMGHAMVNSIAENLDQQADITEKYTY